MPPAHVFRNILNHLKITYTSWQVLYSVRLHCSEDDNKVYTWAIPLYLLFKKDLLYLKLCVYVSMWVCTREWRCSWRPEAGLDPRSWSSRQFYPTWVLGTELLSSRGGYALNHRATSLALPKRFQSVKGRLLCPQTEKQLVYKMFHPDTVPDIAHLALYKLYLIWSLDSHCDKTKRPTYLPRVI